MSYEINSVLLLFHCKVRPISKGVIQGSPQMFRIFTCQEENLVTERAAHKLDIAVCMMLFSRIYIFQPQVRPEIKKLWKTLRVQRSLTPNLVEICQAVLEKNINFEQKQFTLNAFFKKCGKKQVYQDEMP